MNTTADDRWRAASTSTLNWTRTCPTCASTSPPCLTTEHIDTHSTHPNSPPSNPLVSRTQTQLRHSLSELIDSYQALNSRTVPELQTPPGALEFCREFVGVNRPVVIRARKGEGKRDGEEWGDVPALRKWSREYLVAKMEGKKVEVAVSPDGQADSIVRNPKDGTQYFVEPASVQMDLETLFQHLNTPPKSGPNQISTPSPVYYLQSQNGNLQVDRDLEPLLEDVGEKGPEWAREAFGSDPDAANVWIGDGRSSTSVHKDPYENIYLVIRGTKTFTLYPPTEFVCLGERAYPHASYSFDSEKEEFEIVPTEGVRIPWLSVDPFVSNVERTTWEKEGEGKGPNRIEDLFHSDSESKLSEASHEERTTPKLEALARPLTVVLKEGDYLYLPSLWFHAVRQEGRRRNGERDGGDQEQEGDRAVIAVNWWYDMKMHGQGWSMNEFLRGVSRIAVQSQSEGTEEG